MNNKNLHTPNSKFGKFVIHSILLGFSIFFIIPIIWVALAPSLTDTQLSSGGAFQIGSLIQYKIAWENLYNYNNFQILQWAINSFIYAFFGVLLSLISSIPAGYILATKVFFGRKMILIITLIAMITPNSALVLPLFLEMSQFNLINTYTGIILATGFFPFGVYLAYIYFSSNIPPNLVDAGKMDGCNDYQVFYKIALPLSGPAIAIVSFFSFISNWSNYFLAFIFLSDDRLYNLPVGLQALLISSGALNSSFASQIPVKKPEALLAGLFVVVPVFILLLFSQRFIKEGLLTGADKG